MNKFRILLGIILSSSSTMTFCQVSQSIKLNEVMTNNATGLQDEYGQHEAWVEIANISHSTYDIRGMFLTTDRTVLNPEMSVPERIKRMSIIPSGDANTKLSARQHIVFYCNSNPARGTHHLSVKVNPDKPTWIALYDGNATILIDSVTVPILGVDQSYAREKDGYTTWEIRPKAAVTPNISNYIQVDESKMAKLKRNDPNGIGITVLAMGIVFFCLALLFIFFTLFGIFMKHRSTAKKMANIQPLKAGVKTVEKTVEIGHKTNVILQDGLKSKGIDKETYIAIIALALQQYNNNVHDVESGIITIKPKDTEWDNAYIQMTQFHE